MLLNHYLIKNKRQNHKVIGTVRVFIRSVLTPAEKEAFLRTTASAARIARKGLSSTSCEQAPTTESPTTSHSDSISTSVTPSLKETQGTSIFWMPTQEGVRDLLKKYTPVDSVKKLRQFNEFEQEFNVKFYKAKAPEKQEIVKEIPDSKISELVETASVEPVKKGKEPSPENHYLIKDLYDGITNCFTHARMSYGRHNFFNPIVSFGDGYNAGEKKRYGPILNCFLQRMIEKPFPESYPRRELNQTEIDAFNIENWKMSIALQRLVKEDPQEFYYVTRHLEYIHSCKNFDAQDKNERISDYFKEIQEMLNNKKR